MARKLCQIVNKDWLGGGPKLQWIPKRNIPVISVDPKDKLRTPARMIWKHDLKTERPSTGPPQARIKQWDIYTKKVKIAESTSNLNITNISEAESAYNNDNTGSVLAVLKNSSNSDIRITSEMRDKRDNGNTRNITEDKIVDSTHYTEVAIQEVKESMVRPEVEIKHQNNAKKIRKDETIAKDASKKDCTNITNHEEIRSQSRKGRVKSPTCANHLTNGKK